LGDQIGGQSDETWRGRRLRGSGETTTAEKVCIAYLASCHPGLIFCRSLDVIEKRSEALLGKGKVARVLDKTQDASAVTKLIDQLQKAILIYQVCAKISRLGAGLTRTMAGVSTAIDPQPGRTVDSKFPRVGPRIELTDRLLIQVLVRRISETERGKMTRGCFGVGTDVLIANPGDNWEN